MQKEGPLIANNEERESAIKKYEELYKEFTLLDYRLPGETPILDREMQMWEVQFEAAGVLDEDDKIKKRRLAREQILDDLGKELNELDLKLPPAEIDRIRRKVQDEVTAIKMGDDSSLKDLKQRARKFLGLS